MALYLGNNLPLLVPGSVPRKPRKLNLGCYNVGFSSETSSEAQARAIFAKDRRHRANVMGDIYRIPIGSLSATCILAGAAAGRCNPWRLAQQDKHGSQAGHVGLDADKLWARNRATGQAHDRPLHVLAQQRRVLFV